MAAYPPMNDSNNHYINFNGFAIEQPGAGTYYYTIWMTSSPSSSYSEMTINLTVLQIQ
jgi:hypothetical protein